MSRSAFTIAAKGAPLPPQGRIAVRATLRIRNDALISARERLGLSQAAAAQLAGVPIQRLSGLERFHCDASNLTSLRHDADRIAGVLEIDPAQVLPESLVGKTLLDTHERRFEAAPTLLLRGGMGSDAIRLTLPETTEQATNTAELAAAIDKALSSLTFRQREVLKCRFGLGIKPLSLDDTAKIFRVTRERVRQIEHKAVDRLRSADNDHLLAPFLDLEPLA